MRARELKSGGVLALFNFGIDEEGRWLGHTGGVSMFDRFNAHWKAMADEGRITVKEYRQTNFPQVYRTVEQFTAPLMSHGPVQKAGLLLEHVETRVVRCPFAEAHANGEYGDDAAFAKAYIPTLRSWSEPVFAAGLAGRPAAEISELVDEFYGRYEAEVAADPTGHGMDYVHCYLICRKV